MTKSLKRRTIESLLLLTVPLWLDTLGWLLAYSPFSVLNYIGIFMLGVGMMLVLGFIFALGVILVAPFVALFRKHRIPALVATGKAFVFAVCYVSGMILGVTTTWRSGVESTIARGEPLVAAIKEYVTANGHPPKSLDELTPQYIEPIPTTGIGIHPQFHYIVDEPKEYDGNPWVLMIVPPSRPMGFDSILYFPLQNYPKSGYGGGIERIQSWGYVHE